MGKDVLVGRDDGLARRKGRGDQRPGRLAAADQLDHDVDLGRRDEMGRSVGQEILGNPGGSGPGRVADRDPGEDDPGAVKWGEALRLVAERPGDRAADGSGTQQPDAQRRMGR